MQVKAANKRFMPGTSRGPRNAATLLAQMDDLQRGGRIKELREGRHLTQPVVADRVGVTLRAYQEWEAGGGIQWENAKRLAKVLGSNPDYLMSGPKQATPDLSNEDQLDRIERNQAAILQEIRELRALLSQTARDELERALEEGAALPPEQPADSTSIVAGGPTRSGRARSTRARNRSSQASTPRKQAP